MKTAETVAIEVLSKRLYEVAAPLLKGQPRAYQSAALADLVSCWLAGHNLISDDDDAIKSAAATYALREQLLRDYIALLRDLIPETAKEIGTIVTYHPNPEPEE